MVVDGEPLKSVTPVALMGATLADLQAQATSRGISTSGTKAELQARIAQHDAGA